MPLTACQLHQPLIIKAINRGQYFVNDWLYTKKILKVCKILRNRVKIVAKLLIIGLYNRFRIKKLFFFFYKLINIKIKALKEFI